VKKTIVKKTTTEEKKTNGDVVKEEVTKTTTVSVDQVLLIEDAYKNGLESKVNGTDGIDLGNGEPIQMVLDTAAD
jgi:hypothetical protein